MEIPLGIVVESHCGDNETEIAMICLKKFNAGDRDPIIGYVLSSASMFLKKMIIRSLVKFRDEQDFLKTINGAAVGSFVFSAADELINDSRPLKEVARSLFDVLVLKNPIHQASNAHGHGTEKIRLRDTEQFFRSVLFV